MSSDIVRALAPVVEAFESLGIAYRVGGSVASSALGVPRSTLDVDVVCTMQTAHVAEFVRALAPDYYVDAEMIAAAIAQRSSFNLIHLATMTKVDAFIARGDIYDREVFRRVTKKPLEEGTREFDLTTAEDIVLRKLEWYRLGGGVSERQWGDVVGVLSVQHGALDIAYLERWADALDVAVLLRRALAESR